MTDMVEVLQQYGADPASLHLFDTDGPELLPYATVVSARRGEDATLDVVGAVYEWQGSPLMFLVDADLLKSDDHLRRIRRLLAMRGDAPYLGVVSPGRLDVYRLALDNKSLRQVRLSFNDEAVSRVATLARLGNVRPDAAIRHRSWISNVVLRLLTASINKLIATAQVSDEDAISLVGRALFTRFLSDRKLMPEHISGSGSTATLFDNRVLAETTSRWLDRTFNGDLLPLSDNLFSRLNPGAYSILGDVLRRAPNSQLFLGWEEAWNSLDFAHIPVGVLSQAYELYLRNHVPRRQRLEGGYYTPQPIADLMVRACFRALTRNQIASTARVLDPAAGGGVFLLTAFRELVAERWRTDKARPKTDTLRSILYSQVVGFDINEAALRFAALGLYLMSIELDPDPKPVDKLRFENLRGTVLYKVTTKGEPEGAKLGSLGPIVGDQHRARYDLVIGNPPWASGTQLPDWHLVRATVARIAADRRTSIKAPPLPNEGLDLPFVWRSMEWAKPDGQIAFALHARLLFQQGDGMAAARQALFEALDITSIINGVELRQTQVWPEIAAPFCILLAANRVPKPGGGFRLISPRLEKNLNDAGRMRVDAINAEVVQAKSLAETPDLLKILFRGSKADLGIVERIRSHGHPTLESFWSEAIGKTDRGHLLGSGSGYQRLRASSRRRRRGDGLPGVDAKYLHGLPELAASSFRTVSVDSSVLPRFSLDRIHDPRSIDLFTGPVLVVHKSPPAETGRIGVALSEEALVFNETFYGYSPHKYPDAHTLARYLTLVLGSKFAVWFALVTSGEFGFEREVIEKATLDRIPIPDFRKIEDAKKRDIEALFGDLQSGTASWDDVDSWVSKLYGLSPHDSQVISDTLEFNLPFAANKRKAQESPSAPEQEQFCVVLSRELLPWCERFGTHLAVDLLQQPASLPWHAIEIRTNDRNREAAALGRDWAGILRAADETAASEVLLRDGTNRLLIGLLRQKRYWSKTQARLLAQRVVWSHLDLLKGNANG